MAGRNKEFYSYGRVKLLTREKFAKNRSVRTASKDASDIVVKSSSIRCTTKHALIDATYELFRLVPVNHLTIPSTTIRVASVERIAFLEKSSRQVRFRGV
jgi:hypothetical protein